MGLKIGTQEILGAYYTAESRQKNEEIKNVWIENAEAKQYSVQPQMTLPHIFLSFFWIFYDIFGKYKTRVKWLIARCLVVILFIASVELFFFKKRELVVERASFFLLLMALFYLNSVA